MAACWRCRTSTPAGANYCPSCGASIGTEPAQLDILVEPGSGGTGHVEAADPADPRWLLLVAFVLIGGLVAFFAFVGEDDRPAADSEEAAQPGPLEGDEVEPTDADDGADTTTEPPAEPAEPDPEPLEWSFPLEGEGFPIGLVEIRNSRFLYTVDSTTGFTGGPRSRTYGRGAEGPWVEIGAMVDPDATVNSVAATDTGAIATGLDADGRPTVWRTSDGVQWTSEALPAGDDPGAVPVLAAVSGDTTVVLGQVTDPYLALIDLVVERYGDTAGIYPEFRVDDEPVIVRGPFGAAIDELQPAETGLSLDGLEGFYENRRTTLWEHDGTEWSTSDVDGEAVDLFVLDNGQITRTILGNAGPEVSIRDATGWGEPIDLGSAWQVFPWGNRFLGVDDQDGLTVIGPGPDDTRRLDVPGTDAFTSAVADGDNGLAIVRYRYDAISRATDEPETVVVLRDGFALTAEYGTLALTQGEDELFRGRLDAAPGPHRIDTIDGDLVVTFLTEDGTDLVSFTVAELADLQARTDFVPAPDNRIEIWFTREGDSWFGGPVTGGDVAGVARSQIHLGDGTITAALLMNTRYDIRLTEPLRFQIVEAPLPD